MAADGRQHSENDSLKEDGTTDAHGWTRTVLTASVFVRVHLASHGNSSAEFFAGLLTVPGANHYHFISETCTQVWTAPMSWPQASKDDVRRTEFPSPVDNRE